MTSRVTPAGPALGPKRQGLEARLLPLTIRARKRKKRRTSLPLTSIAPAGLTAGPSCATLLGVNPKRKKMEIVEDTGEEYLRKLHALFHACDDDNDGVLSTGELSVLLQMIGMSETEANAAARRSSTLSPTNIDTWSSNKANLDFRFLPPNLKNAMYHNAIVSSTNDEALLSNQLKIGTSFDSFLSNCRDMIVQCFRAGYLLPTRAFLIQCRPLKRGFQNCDSDGSLVITRTELEIALQKLDLIFGDDELDRVMSILDQNKNGVIEWCDLLLVAWKNTQLGAESNPLSQYFSVELFSELPSFIKVPQAAGCKAPILTTRNSRSLFRLDSDSRSTLRYLSRIEDIGIRLLTKASEKRLVSTKRALSAISFERADDTNKQHGQQGPQLVRRLSRHTSSGPSFRRKTDNSLPVTARKAIFRLEALTTIIGAAAGILFGLVSIGLEDAIIPSSLDSNSASYYVYTGLLNIAVSLIEVHMLYLTTLISAFRLTVSANLTLYPLDREREFLTRAIARAALQAGNRKEALFGIDPMRGSPRLVAILTLLLYKSKRFAVKFLLKLLIKRVLWRAAARTALSLLVLPINALSNGWTLHRVMQHCRVNIIGPGSLISVLEVFMLEDDCFSPDQRVDYMRAIGCAIVSKRAIHPNAEIMVGFLRHKWICSDLWPVKSSASGSTGECSCLEKPELACKTHPLDDTALFLSTLERYGSILDIVNPTGQVTTISAKHAVSARRSSGTFSVRNSGESHQPVGVSERRHVRNVFFLLVIALICDGNLGWAERKLYVRCCQAAGVLNRWSRVLQVKQVFVAGKGIDVDAVYSLVESRETTHTALRAKQIARGANNHDGMDSEEEEEEEDSAGVPLSESLQYFWNRLAGLMSC